jgi:hypothetical protein
LTLASLEPTRHEKASVAKVEPGILVLPSETLPADSRVDLSVRAVMSVDSSMVKNGDCNCAPKHKDKKDGGGDFIEAMHGAEPS